jgi:eukaryotic-like serine/threonine-protein kinase
VGVTAREPAGGRDEVESLAEEFLERHRRGERPAIEEYVQRRPDLAREIREVFPTLLLLEDLGPKASGKEAPAAPGDLPEGLRQVGGYRVLREVGRGGMGIVYEAVQEGLGRRVALKVLPHHSLLGSNQLERFQQEARAAARLSHPNIVPVFDVGQDRGLPYYVMQLVPGRGLDLVIEEERRGRDEGRGRIPLPGSDASTSHGDRGTGTSGGGRAYHRSAARVARDAALALDHAHREGVLHRDVKPSNLLVDATGHVWLTDFGLAKTEEGEGLTHSGDFVGTVRYMAPERFQGWSDPRSDVYSLGLTLYELLALRAAFVETDRARLLREVAEGDPPALRRVDRAIHRDLETVVLKAIAKEPSQRYATARAMADDLDRYLRGEPVEARRSSALGRLVRWGARNPALAGLGVSVLLLLAAVAGVASTAAVRLARERDAGRAKLRDSYLSQARAHRASGRTGRRYDALEALRHAAEIRPGRDLCDEAIACLSLPDARRVKVWEKASNVGAFFDSGLRRMASGRQGGEIVIRSTEDDRELLLLPGPEFHADHVFARFSPDGRHLAVHYQQNPRNEWIVWDLDRRAPVVRVPDASEGSAFDFGPGGRCIALGVRGGSVRVFDLNTRELVSTVAGNFDFVHLAIHPGGRLLAGSDGRSGNILLIDLENGEVQRVFRRVGPSGFIGVAWHPEGRLLAAAGGLDRKVYVWDAQVGGRGRVLEGHDAEAVYVSFASGGDLLLSTGWDAKVRFWDPGTGRALFDVAGQWGGFGSDPPSFWTNSLNGAERWEIAPARAAFTLTGHEGKVAKHPYSISLAGGLGLAATTGDDGVRLWDLASRREAAHLASGATTSALFDARGEHLYTSGAFGLLRWPVRATRGQDGPDDPPAGPRRRSLVVGPPEPLNDWRWVRDFALGDADRSIAFVHESRVARLARIDDPGHSLALEGPRSVESVALSPDGRWAAAGGARDSSEVQVWDAREGKPARRLPGQSARVEFDPAGAHLVTATPQEYVFWRTSDWTPAWRIERSPGLTFSGRIAFDRSGKAAALTQTDSGIWVIDPAGGGHLSKLEVPGDQEVRGLALDLEGGYLAATTPDGGIHVWDLKKLAREMEALGLDWDVPAGAGGERSDAPLRVEVIAGEGLPREEGEAGPRARDLFRKRRSALFLRELGSTEEIDRALEAPRLLIPEGTEWRFARGYEEPSPGLEWTRSDFDDSEWETGISGIGGLDRDEGEAGTTLEDQAARYSTVYLRRGFQAPPPPSIDRILLAVECEGGYVAYLNGNEVARSNAGAPGTRVARDGTAARDAVGRVVDLREVDSAGLREGRNVLSIQAIARSRGSSLFVLPVLAAELRPDPAQDRSRTPTLGKDAGDAGDPFLLSYRDARILQRSGRSAEAVAEFERASSLDPSRPEPLLRMVECLRALRDFERAEVVAKSSIEGGALLEEGRMWDAWFQICVRDLCRTPAEALERIPGGPGKAGSRLADSYRWLLQGLSRSEVLRINCGGPGLVEPDGKRWARDRWNRGGVSRSLEGADRPDVEWIGESDPCRTQRYFGGTSAFRPGYRIPLPPGRYRVALHFQETWEGSPLPGTFDVLLEGRAVLEGYEPPRAGSSKPDRRSFDVEVSDGLLEVDFVARSGPPTISAIEIEGR